ncbi:MAG: hypothetical protein KDK37_17410 [Leptospiraceae bacterium]|nr:hypothetical protein [Leptospiraceae bacterium]
MRRFSLFLLVLFSGVGCFSGTVMEPAYGTNYYDQDFECVQGLVPQESDKKYLSRRLTYMAALPQVAPNSHTIITGESTAALFTPERLQTYLPGKNISNRAIPGETTVVFLSALDELVIKSRPRTIILAIGGNDLLGGRCIGTIVQNTELILKTIHQKLPAARVLLLSVPPVVSWKVSSVAGYLNLGFQQLSDRLGYVQYVDLWPYLADEKRPMLAEKYRQVYKGKVDQVHFNEEGYKQFAEALKPYL